MTKLKSPYDQKALELLNATNETFSTDDVFALADDLRAVDEELERDHEDSCSAATNAWSTLRTRIGGLKNLRGYVRTLRATGRHALQGYALSAPGLIKKLRRAGAKK